MDAAAVWHRSPQANFADYAQRVFNVMEPLWTRCVELNNNVILDFGFWSREERVRVREIITAHNGQAVLCRLSCRMTLHGNVFKKK